MIGITNKKIKYFPKWYHILVFKLVFIFWRTRTFLTAFFINSMFNVIKIYTSCTYGNTEVRGQENYVNIFCWINIHFFFSFELLIFFLLFMRKTSMSGSLNGMIFILSSWFLIYYTYLHCLVSFSVELTHHFWSDLI